MFLRKNVYIVWEIHTQYIFPYQLNFHSSKDHIFVTATAAQLSFIVSVICDCTSFCSENETSIPTQPKFDRDGTTKSGQLIIMAQIFYRLLSDFFYLLFSCGIRIPEILLHAEFKIDNWVKLQRIWSGRGTLIVWESWEDKSSKYFTFI